MKTKKIIRLINEMNEDQLIELNNLYCQSIGDMDSEVFLLDEEFFEVMGFSPLEAIQKAHYGDFNYSHKYVTFDGYANFKTFDYFETSDLCELVETMAEYISENFEEFEHLFD
jgi:hypothetical protein